MAEPRNSLPEMDDVASLLEAAENDAGGADDEVVAAPQLSGEGYLDARFQLITAQELTDLSYEFAKAYGVREKGVTAGNERNLYALAYDRKFPVRIEAVRIMQRTESPNLVKVVDAGKVELNTTGEEHFVVILERPAGVPLVEYLKNNPLFEERFAFRRFMEQLLSGLQPFSLAGIAHGRIAPDNIYYDAATSRLIVGECVSEFPSYSQPPGYETLDQLLCHPAGKGDGDVSADFFALGMTLVFMITGKDIYDGMQRDEVLNARLKTGSVEPVARLVNPTNERTMERRNENALKGLLNDDRKERWGLKEVRAWGRMEDVVSSASKVHKEAANALIFDDGDYYGGKRLAHDMHKKWSAAKRTLRVSELVRWVNLSLKKADTSDIIEALIPNPNVETLIADDKLARLIAVLDPDGPIRFQNFSANLYGLGDMLAYIYMSGDRESLQQFAFIFNDGLLQYWIGLQGKTDEYSYGSLGWSPLKVRQNMRKTTMGFGMERVLYDLNSSLPCQSKLPGKYFAATIEELLIALNNYTGPKDDRDPMDRHVAAFIGSHIGLAEDMTVKSLKGYPAVGKNQQVLMLGLLAVAQMEGNVPPVRNLADWIAERLESLQTHLHSKLIRKALRAQIRKAARTGKLNVLYRIVTSPIFAMRDANGYMQARQEYYQLARKVHMLKKRSTIQQLAYGSGLKISVQTAYICLALTIFYVILFSA